jgi:hypothetical protein
LFAGKGIGEFLRSFDQELKAAEWGSSLEYPIVNNRPLSRASFRGWQGATTSNSTALARSRNAARREKAPREWSIIYDMPVGRYLPSTRAGLIDTAQTAKYRHRAVPHTWWRSQPINLPSHRLITGRCRALLFGF